MTAHQPPLPSGLVPPVELKLHQAKTPVSSALDLFTLIMFKQGSGNENLHMRPHVGKAMPCTVAFVFIFELTDGELPLVNCRSET